MTIALSASDIFTPADQPTWLVDLLAAAQAVGLPVTTWQPGDITRTICALVTHLLAVQDVEVSLVAQGGFLDFAATGSITWTNPTTREVTTTPVTPEGGPGPLDVLADGLYDCQRLDAAFAGGSLAVLNTSVSTYGPFIAGTYHVSDPVTGATYSSTEALTIPPATVAGTIFTVVSSFGLIFVTTSAAHGLTTGDTVAISGVTGITPLVGTTAWTVNVLSSTTFTLDGSTFSGTYTGGGSVYVPTLVDVRADVVGTNSNTLDASGVPAPNTVTQTVTSLVGVSVANAAPYTGSDAETNAQLAARCRLRLATLGTGGPKGLQEFYALSASVYAAKLAPPLILASAITRCATFVDRSDGAIYVALANVAGAPSSGDVGVVQAVEDAYGTPNATTVIAFGCTDRLTPVVATVYLPRVHATAATQALFQTAIQAYVGAIPIGGETDPAGAYSNILPLEGIAGAIYGAARASAIKVDNVAILLDGVALDLSLAVLPQIEFVEVPVLSPAVPTVTLVAV